MNNSFKLIGIAILSIVLSSCKGESKSADRFLKSNSNVEKAQQNKYAAGEEVYKTTCMTCHQLNGKGIKGVFPPLAQSDYLLEDINRAIAQVINGSEEEITVNGVVYTGIMPPQAINDEEVRDVINYILNSWGNSGGEVTLEDVRAQKSAG